jgi:UDP-N-acetylglucosamine 4,6-dehydratase
MTTYNMRDFSAPRASLNGKSILVTGGTGSFGQAFVANVLRNHFPRRLIVFSRDEQKHYEMAHRFDPAQYPCMRYFIGDVRDYERLAMAMYEVDIVIHAAAMKHVPAAEYNPMECINTNVHGAENVVRSALENRVQRVVALSTDKACSPINLYGASKLASDKIFVAANNLRGDRGTRFSVVRYGNVIGSNGSVVPLFKKLVEAGAEYIPITDERMTRFWITLNQGVEFVLSSMEIMNGGEIFVPRIPSMSVVDIARYVAPGLPHRLVGIRPGEKLHEVMISEDDARNTIELPDRYVVVPSLSFWNPDCFVVREGIKVGDDFCYSSDRNSEWLDFESLAGLMET